jgi:hypothetical protein
MDKNIPATDRHWSAIELRKLPPKERDAILSKAAEKAETEDIYSCPPTFSNLEELEALLEEGINSGPGREWNAEELARLKQQVLDRAAGNGIQAADNDRL